MQPMTPCSPSAPPRRLAFILTVVLSLPADAEDRPGNVTVYRCTDSRGQLVALRDSPCHSGEHQQTVSMQRPQDPSPRTVSTAPLPAGTTPATAVREVRVVTVQEPRPLFECTAPDGTTYLSETDQVAEHWVPLWTLGYPAVRPPRPQPSPRPATSGTVAISGGGSGQHLPSGVVVPAGTWVRDSCIRLSRQEICSRLSDRRYEILRLYHAAMPSERAALDREQQEIDERMAADCAGY